MRKVIFLMILSILVTITVYLCNNRTFVEKPDPNIKDKFELIYKSWFWEKGKVEGFKGGGSGPGSSQEYTKTCRSILYQVIKQYNIKSMIDAPCGSMRWMPLLLNNITDEGNNDFKYFGVDVVESVINASKIKYANMFPKWKMKVLDFTTMQLPENYDLIFSRDVLQHLPLEKVIDALKTFSQTKGARYLLVGHYLEHNENRNINIGDYFNINLTKPPFNLTQFIASYWENDRDKKYLTLYDLSYLRKIDFDLMKSIN